MNIFGRKLNRRYKVMKVRMQYTDDNGAIKEDIISFCSGDSLSLTVVLNVETEGTKITHKKNVLLTFE